MTSISGLTPVDTLYELLGYRLNAEFLQVLTSVWLPAAIALGGLAYVFHQCLEKGSFRGLASYLVYIVFMWWLISPVQVRTAFPAGATVGTLEQFARLYRSSGKEAPTIAVPRFLVYVHTITDSLVRLLVHRTNKAFLGNPFGPDRLAARLRQSGINDAALRKRYQLFLVACHAPALAAEQADGKLPREYVTPLDPLRLHHQYAKPTLAPIDADGRPIAKTTCEQERQGIWQAMIEHVRGDDEHAETLGLIGLAVAEWNQQGGDPLPVHSADVFLAHQIAFNELMVFSNVVGREIGLLSAAVPEYALFATSQQSSSNVQDAGQWIKSAVSFVVKGFQSVNQWVQNHAEGPATYYKASLYLPHLYGLVQMVLLALFPVAALWALWPGHWKALLNFSKVFVSVKLWVVFWAALAAFNQARYDLVLGNDPSTNGIGNQIEIFPAIAAMYLLTPVLSFMIVSLATNCGAIALQAFVPHASTIGGVHELHREYREMKEDGGAILDGARAANVSPLDPGRNSPATSQPPSERPGEQPTPEPPPVG